MTTRSFSPEIWVPDREAFVFGFHDRHFGESATFCVPEATLKELRPEHPFFSWKAFDAMRSLIYEAAVVRVRSGSSVVLHVMTPQELRALRQDRQTAYSPPGEQSANEGCSEGSPEMIGYRDTDTQAEPGTSGSFSRQMILQSGWTPGGKGTLQPLKTMPAEVPVQAGLPHRQGACMIACKLNPRSNRTCELGTAKCEVHHTDADLMRIAMEEGSAPSVWIEVATKYRFEFVMVAKRASDLVPLVIYRGCISNTVFAMPADEFHLRFKPS